MWLYRILMTLLRPLIKLLFLVKTDGQDNIPKTGGVIIACNHRHAIDPAIIGAGIKRPLRFMAKDDLFKNKLIGWLLHRLGAFPIRRGKADKTGIQMAEEILNTGQVLLIFPEGSRSKDGELLPFKSGTVVLSKKTGCPIIPAWIEPQKGKLKLFCKTSMRYGEPIEPSDLGLDALTVKQGNAHANEVVKKRMKRLKPKPSEFSA